MTLDNELVIASERRSVTRTISSWSPARRQQYLLVPDVAVPVSRDRVVFVPARADDADDDPFHLIVAVSSDDQDGRTIDPLRGYELFGFPELPLSSELVGFDVCDDVRYSALANCGLPPELREKQAAKWGSRLNRFHLFDTADDAARYRAESDLLISEHAPFYVVRLYRRTSLR